MSRAMTPAAAAAGRISLVTGRRTLFFSTCPRSQYRPAAQREAKTKAHQYRRGNHSPAIFTLQLLGRFSDPLSSTSMRCFSSAKAGSETIVEEEKDVLKAPAQELDSDEEFEKEFGDSTTGESDLDSDPEFDSKMEDGTEVSDLSDVEDTISDAKAQKIRPKSRSFVVENLESEAKESWNAMLQMLRKKKYFQLQADDLLKGEAAYEDLGNIKRALLTFSRDRDDIISLLPMKDLEVIAKFGCPSLDRKVVNSGKRLRSHVKVVESDVCQPCTLKDGCSRAYLPADYSCTTADVTRVVFEFGVLLSDGKSVPDDVKSAVGNVLNEMLKLSATPRDPSVPRVDSKSLEPETQIEKKRERGGSRNANIEMKPGDWKCPSCSYTNFCRNRHCRECQTPRPPQDMRPGDWECPDCRFVNFARNEECHDCRAERPKEAGSVKAFHKARGSREKWEGSVNELAGMDFSSGRATKRDARDMKPRDYSDGLDDESDDDFKASIKKRSGPAKPVKKSSRKYDDDDDDDDDSDDDLDFDSDESDEDFKASIKKKASPGGVRGKKMSSKFADSDDDMDLDDDESDEDFKPASKKKSAPAKSSFAKKVKKSSKYDDSEDDVVDLSDDESDDFDFKPKKGKATAVSSRGKKRVESDDESDDDDWGDVDISDDEESEEEVRGGRGRGRGRGGMMSSRGGRGDGRKSWMVDDDDGGDSDEMSDDDFGGRGGGGRGGGGRFARGGGRGGGGRSSFAERNYGDRGGRSSFGDRNNSYGDRGGGSYGSRGGGGYGANSDSDDEGGGGGGFRGRGRRGGFRGGRGSSFGDRNSSFGDRNSSFGDRSSSYGERNSSYGDRNGSYGRDRDDSDSDDFGGGGGGGFSRGRGRRGGRGGRSSFGDDYGGGSDSDEGFGGGGGGGFRGRGGGGRGGGRGGRFGDRDSFGGGRGGRGDRFGDRDRDSYGGGGGGGGGYGGGGGREQRSRPYQGKGGSAGRGPRY